MEKNRVAPTISETNGMIQRAEVQQIAEEVERTHSQKDGKAIS